MGIDPDTVTFATIDLSDPEERVSVDSRHGCKEALTIDLEDGCEGWSVVIEHIHDEL